MSAFDSNRTGGMGAEDGMEDMLAQMFGMDGIFRMQGEGTKTARRRKGLDEEHSYNVTLEELYKGKTAKFASTKNVICSHCQGTGGKEKAKTKQCASCQGKGAYSSWLNQRLC